MRYIDEVIFVKASEESKYDPNLGEWVDGESQRTITLANVTDVGTDRLVTIFGDIKQGAKVIRLQPLFVVPEWDRIEIESKTYQLTTDRLPLNRTTLIVEEVKVDGQKFNQYKGN